jgi:hypothetical protein
LLSSFFGCLFLDQNLWRYRCPPTQKIWPSLTQVEAINLPWMALPSTLSSKCQTFLFVLQLYELKRLVPGRIRHQATIGEDTADWENLVRAVVSVN